MQALAGGYRCEITASNPARHAFARQSRHTPSKADMTCYQCTGTTHSARLRSSLQVYTAMVQVVCPSCPLSACSLEAFGIPVVGEAILATCGPEAFVIEPFYSALPRLSACDACGAEHRYLDANGACMMPGIRHAIACSSVGGVCCEKKCMLIGLKGAGDKLQALPVM